MGRFLSHWVQAGLSRVTLGQVRDHLLERDVQPVAVAGLGLVFEGRPLAEVEVDQVFPFLGRATLQGDAGTGVATAAHLAGLVVEMLDGIEPALHSVTHAFGLAGCQALLVRQVLDQGATVIVADLQPMHHLHARNAHQPAFGGLALVTDAAVTVVTFGDVAPHALRLQQARALLGRHGLGAQQCGGDQRQFARMPPESSRLQGQTSTVLFLSLSHALIPLVHVTRADTESVPACAKPLFSIDWGLFSEDFI